ncbi:MAG: hypothetical protein R3224_04520 [Balneolaceae bacterium]|nr:hypothetical protein [Balneolaceae bacterium]
MIIGSEFNRNSRKLLKEIGRIAGGDRNLKIPVEQVNQELQFDRNTIKNQLEYLEALGYIKIATIGGALLYGHVRITYEGIRKYHQLRD